MSYPALPARRMGYDNDGTVMGIGPAIGVAVSPDSIGAGIAFDQGIASWATQGDMAKLNGVEFATLGSPISFTSPAISAGWRAVWLWFPEKRVVSGLVMALSNLALPGSPACRVAAVQGSTDSSNGVDGSWETATLGGAPLQAKTLDGWREGVQTVSFSGAVSVVRICLVHNSSTTAATLGLLHLYGAKDAGQTPDDILMLDPDAADAEWAVDPDFGDRPLGTTVVQTFKIQNASGTKTANGIVLLCDDTDFAISSDGLAYGTTINIASLGAGAKSGTLYIRNTTPAVGATLRPRAPRIVHTVASWS